jgi:hypothetical protein
MTSEKICSNCIHSTLSASHTLIYCEWEKSHLPPPIFRARLWGEARPQTKDEWAEDCSQFKGADHE